MGCDQSTDAGARWRRTYASDFNTERPARRNLTNNTYILGTKFPTSQNYASQDKLANEKSGSQTIAMASFGGSRNDTGADKKKETYNNSSAVTNASNDKYGSNLYGAEKTSFAALGLSEDEFKNLKVYTPEDLSLHNKENDCWMSIYGVIVDVTEFIPTHVGGASMVMGEAGKDATAAFKRVHKNITKAEEMIRNNKTIRIVGRLLNYEAQETNVVLEDEGMKKKVSKKGSNKKDKKKNKKDKRRDDSPDSRERD